MKTTATIQFGLNRMLSTTIYILLFFFICITAGMAIEYTSDYNKDGKPDKWCTLSADGRTIVTELDQNFDGIRDYKSKYYRDGKPIYEEFDYNYDGKMDTFYFYDNGKLIKEEIDTNYDGKVDVWVYLYKGIYIERIERDTDFNGEVDKIKDYSQSR